MIGDASNLPILDTPICIRGLNLLLYDTRKMMNLEKAKMKGKKVKKKKIENLKKNKIR